MTIIGETTVAVRADTSHFETDTVGGVDRAAEGSKNSMTKHLGGIALAVGSAFAADKIVDFFKGGIESITNMDRISQQTSAVVKSTGGAAGISAKAVGDYANAMERKTGIEAESIQSGQNMLLTFTNIKNGVGAGNDVFNQASNTLLDLSTAMGGDTKGAAIQLGKALNDPTTGITALTKVGVTFTDQQKDQIKAMQAAGDTAGAQKLILGELNKEFGGSAEAFGKSGAGGIAKFKNEMGNLQDELVGAFLPTGIKLIGFFAKELPPTVDLISSVFHTVGGAIKDVVSGLTKGTDDVGTAQTKFAVFGAVVRGIFYQDVVPAFNVAKEVFEVVTNFLRDHMDQIKAFFTEAWTTISTIVSTEILIVKTVIEVAVAVISYIWANWGGQIKSVVEIVFNFISRTIKDTLAIVTAIMKLATDLIHGDWGKVWGDIKDILSAVWDQIKNIISTALALVGQLLSIAWDGIKILIGLVWDGIVGFFRLQWQIISGIFSGALNALTGTLSGAWGAITGAVSGAWNGIAGIFSGAWGGIKNSVSSGISGVVSFFEGIPGRIVGAVGNVGSLLSNVGRDIVNGLKSGIEGAWHFVTDKMHDLINAIPAPVRKLLGISSPSKVFAEIGHNIMKGMMVGIDAGGPAVAETLQGHMANLTNITGAGGGTSYINSGTSSNSVVNNIYAAGGQGEYGWTSALQRQELLRARRS